MHITLNHWSKAQWWISYLLLSNIYPKALWLQTAIIHYLTHSVGQELRSGIVRGLGYLEIKMLAKTVAIWKLVWGWKNHFQKIHSCGCWRKFSFPLRSMSLWQSGWLPSEWLTQEKEQGRSHGTFLNPGSELHTVIFTMLHLLEASH